MTITITRAGDSATTTPKTILLPDDVIDESRNIEHDLLSGDMAITLIPPRPGTGDMTLVYDDETAARAARGLHRVADSFLLVGTENTARNSTYVVGSGGTRLGRDRTSEYWQLVASYREVDL